MQFDEALAYLLSLGHETLAIKLGLRNIELLLDVLGCSKQKYPSVQIAGTNGKGSTAVFLERICRVAGIRTGLYTSPHLVSITERIKVCGTDISKDSFAAYLSQVKMHAEDLLRRKQIEGLPTFFEHITAMALLAFRESKVDLAILETGLGGRLDATTAANAGIVAITPIAFDHEEYLGNSLTKIAAEKAAIIRPGVKAIVAAQLAEALEVIMDRCREVNVEPILDASRDNIEETSRDGHLRVSIETDSDRYEQVRLGLRGRHQIRNASVAVRLAEALRGQGFHISRSEIIKGLEEAEHHGRLELFDGQPSVLLDGAHNPAGVRVLRDYLEEFQQKPVTLVFGAMRDKNLSAMIMTLLPIANHLVLTEIENPRAASIEVLAQLVTSIADPKKISLTRSSAEAMKVAREQTESDGLICCAGSLHLIGEIRQLLLKPSEMSLSVTSK